MPLTPAVWVGHAGGAVVPAVAATVRAQFAQGADDAQIGRAIGSSARLAKRVRLALDLHRAAAPVSDAAFVEACSAGLTLGQVAERTGLSPRTVADRANALDLQLAPELATPRQRVTRDKTLPVRFTADQVARIQGAAAAAGVSFSAYVRARLLE